jgi:hypothetical protein
LVRIVGSKYKYAIYITCTYNSGGTYRGEPRFPLTPSYRNLIREGFVEP